MSNYTEKYMDDFIAKKYQGILVQLLGCDGQAFLQRLTSIDVTMIKEGDMVLSAFLDAKASVLAVFYLFKKHSQLSLLVSDTYKKEVIEYIDKMHFFEDFQLNIEDVSWLEVRYKNLPSKLKNANGYTLKNWNINQKIIKGRVLFHNEINTSIKDFLEKSLNEHQFHLYECQSISPCIDSNLFRSIMILDGPFDHFLSRDKGCYPGQEVAEKIYSIGRRPKKMVCCQIDTASTSIEVPENLLAENKKVGKLLHVVELDKQTCMGLAILRHTCDALKMLTELKEYQVRIVS